MEHILDSIRLYKKKFNGENNRTNFPDHEGAIFGIIKPRGSKNIGLSYHTRKYPDVYEKLKQLDVPITYTSIQINKNLVCPKHTDKHNVGLSYIISFGDYTGGELVIDDIPHDTRTGLIFDGSKPHWNTPLIGKKYSVTFFTTSCVV